MLKSLDTTEAKSRVTITLRNRVTKENELIISEESMFWKAARIQGRVFVVLKTILTVVC